MSAQLQSVPQPFTPSRRVRGVLLGGVLLLVGYLGAGALLIRDYVVQSSTVGTSA
jgi:hypothetical protein